MFFVSSFGIFFKKGFGERDVEETVDVIRYLFPECGIFISFDDQNGSLLF